MGRDWNIKHRCPKCDSENVERTACVDTRAAFDGMKFYHELHCYHCSFKWRESR